MDRLTAWLFGNNVSEITNLIQVRTVSGCRGLYATADIPDTESSLDNNAPKPNTHLLDIPGRFLLNKFTLTPPPDSQSLTSTQLICLHIALDALGDEFWSPFLTSLPDNFDEHPLLWTMQPEGSFGQTCLSLLPLQTYRAVLQMRERFERDLSIIQEYAVLAKILSRTIDTSTWARAWLAVNTRCIYLDVEPQGGIDENLSLVPLVDFANHTSNREQSCSFAFNYKNDVKHDSFGRPVAPQSGSLISPPLIIERDQEIFLEYGQHSNSYLMEEYGFVLPRKASSDPGEVILDHYLEPLLLARAPSCKELLERWGYWGDWKLHTFPEPTPSYRTLIVCRLLHLDSLEGIIDDSDSSPWNPFPFLPHTISSYEEDSYERWKACVLGHVDHVSATNEQKVGRTLYDLCSRVVFDAHHGIEEIVDDDLRGGQEQARISEMPSWGPFSLQCIKYLWQEQADVALAVRTTFINAEDL